MISTGKLALFCTCSHCHVSTIIFFFSIFLFFLFNPGSFVLHSPLLFSLLFIRNPPRVYCCASHYPLAPSQQSLIIQAVNSQEKRNFPRAALIAFIFWLRAFLGLQHILPGHLFPDCVWLLDLCWIWNPAPAGQAVQRLNILHTSPAQIQTWNIVRVM